MANTVRILITAKDEISGSLDRIKDKASLLSKTDIGKGMLQGAGIAGFNMLKGAALGALDAVASFAAGSVQAAADEERSIARLNASLAANVKGWEGQTAAIEKGINAGERLGFSDDAVRDSLAKLVGATKDVGKAYEIMAVAQDLARFKGIDLVEASTALIKVEGGQYRALKELGIVLRDGATATEALAEVQRVAGGQAAAYTETLAGKTEILSNKLDNLQETIGGAVIPALSNLADATIGLGDSMDKAFGGGTARDQIDGLFEMVKAATTLTGTTQLLSGTLDDLHAELNAEIEATAAAAKAWDTGSEALANFREPATKAAHKAEALAEANKRAATGFKAVRDNAKAAADRLEDIKDAADDARDALIEAAFGPEETRLSLEKAKLEGKDLRDELKQLEGKKPTRDVRIDVLDTKLAIIDNKKEVIELQGDLTTLGKTKLTTHEASVRGLKNDWSDAGDELRTYLRLLAQVPGVKLPKGNGSGGGGHGGGGAIPTAAGGPRSPYSTLLVGENGPEVIRLGASGGHVNPSAAAAMSGGGGGSITINVSTPVMTPGAAQAMADAIAPHVTRWQQARGL